MCVRTGAPFCHDCLIGVLGNYPKLTSVSIEALHFIEYSQESMCFPSVPNVN